MKHSKWPRSLILLAICSLIQPVVSLAGVIPKGLPAVAAGGAVSGGMRLSLASWQAAFALGQPVPIVITLANVSGKGMNATYDELARALRFKVKDGSGRDIPSRGRALSGGVVGGGVYLSPKEPRPIPVHLDDWVSLKTSGTYTVTAILDVYLPDTGKKVRLESNPIVITVSP